MPKLRYLVFAGVALIVIVTCMAYWPSLHGAFILDDNIYLTDAAAIQAPDGLFRIWCTAEAVDYYPVSNSTLWLEWRLWGLDPTGYHITNLLLHIFTALLVWRVL